MRRILVVAALIGTLATSAFAQGLADVQRQFIEDLAQVLAGTQVCTRYRLNQQMAAFVAVRFRVLLNHPGIQERLQERTRFHRDRIKGRGEDDICGALKRLYGPEGVNVKNLVLPK